MAFTGRIKRACAANGTMLPGGREAPFQSRRYSTAASGIAAPTSSDKRTNGPRRFDANRGGNKTVPATLRTPVTSSGNFARYTYVETYDCGLAASACTNGNASTS